jgi:hypothetical protein
MTVGRSLGLYRERPGREVFGLVRFAKPGRPRYAVGRPVAASITLSCSQTLWRSRIWARGPYSAAGTSWPSVTRSSSNVCVRPLSYRAAKASHRAGRAEHSHHLLTRSHPTAAISGARHAPETSRSTAYPDRQLVGGPEERIAGPVMAVDRLGTA